MSTMADYTADEWTQLLRGLIKAVSADQATREAPEEPRSAVPDPRDRSPTARCA